MSISGDIAIQLTLYVILNFIGISSGMFPVTKDFLSNFGKSEENNNDQELNSLHGSSTHDTSLPRVPRGSLSSVSSRTENIFTRPHSPINPSAPDTLPVRSRTRSPPARSFNPPTRLPSSDGRTHGIEDLQFIRLIPEKNPNRLFQLQRYTFTANTAIRIQTGRHKFGPVPHQEQIVLSTFNGEVFAILDATNTLAGLYKYFPRMNFKARAKVNIGSGTIYQLTAAEIAEAPVGSNRLISAHFRIMYLNNN